ncbi:MAG TPA: acyl-CoA desaturase [Rhizobiales bacterium]|jgi:stearoyl-CoA desaturase (delta-9 desaturase)|nr:acyl-CoA desaturase [Hyphomicrobiales bacterium]HAN63857.1 acyl-CoA desaturase [Hyphomicrobiales bacterium]HBR27083.1 acyl-CoA desaturase [Hyphomicrobiales bacterium]HCL61436.1 acyl-CoA desaturase [Hyphomicrobiales bacterium]
MSPDIDVDGEHDDIIYPSAIPFVLVHLACFGAIWSGVTWQAVAICVTLYWLRIFAIGAGYHRYFSHRAYATNRVFQFVLALVAQSTAQKSVLWWASKHRHHHLHSDTEQDVHSPRHKGFIYSHAGWIFARKHDKPDLAKVTDLMRYPELMWLHKFELLPAVVLALLCFLAAGWSGLVVGFFWSTVLVYHATFCINSLAHVSGSTRYVTGDDSRNNWLLAVFTMGEGWHNNHHAFQSSVRQGFRWWEIDPTYYLLRALSWTGLVWDLRTPPEQVLRNEQRLGVAVINRAAEQLAAHFNSERIAAAITSALHGPELSALRETLTRTQNRATEVLMTLHLPHIPSREEFLREARAMFARTKSLDEIVDRAYELLLASVGTRLAASIQSRS